MRQEILPLDMNFFREGSRIERFLERLDTLWRDIRSYLHGSGRQQLRAREAAALTASARWIWTSAAKRPETRGIHRRIDYPRPADALTRSIQLIGVDSPS